MFYEGFEKKRERFLETNKNYASLISVNSPSFKEGEVQKYYTFDQTGSIMLSTTESNYSEIDPDVKELFKKAGVFLAAVVAALSRKNKTLFDYDALDQIITKSGIFANLDRQDREFNYSSTELTLNTAIISDALANINALGGALDIAKRIIDSLGSKIRAASSSTSDSKKIAHLLLICENLMGLPIVTVSIFYVDSKETQEVSKSNCHEHVHNAVKFKYYQSIYMFVEPGYISKFSEEFKKDPAYEELISQLEEYID